MDSSQKVPVGNSAVLCSLAELPDGSLRVVLDDVERGSESAPWTHRSLFTFTDYTADALNDLANRPESELASVGYYVLTRLLVSNGHGT